MQFGLYLIYLIVAILIMRTIAIWGHDSAVFALTVTGSLGALVSDQQCQN